MSVRLSSVIEKNERYCLCPPCGEKWPTWAKPVSAHITCVFFRINLIYHSNDIKKTYRTIAPQCQGAYFNSCRKICDKKYSGLFWLVNDGLQVVRNKNNSVLSRTTPRYLYEWTDKSCRSQQNMLKVRSSCESTWLAGTNIACVFFTFICKPRSSSQLYTLVTAWVSSCEEVSGSAELEKRRLSSANMRHGTRAISGRALMYSVNRRGLYAAVMCAGIKSFSFTLFVLRCFSFILINI